MPRRRRADRAADRGTVFQAQFAAARRSRRAEQHGAASRAQRAGSDALLPAGRAGAPRPLACRRARRLRQRRLSLPRASVHRCRGPLPLAYHLAGALHRPHPPLPRQGAGAAAARAHHSALFSGRADEPPRRTVPPRAGDANVRGRRRARRAVRFCARHALERPSRLRAGKTMAQPVEQAQPQKAFPVSWDQFHRDARALAWRLAGAGPFQAIVCVTRGGLVPAAIVARELGIRLIETVCVSSYNHITQGELKVLKDVARSIVGIGGGRGKGVLIVDDLVDTGKTATVVREVLPEAHFATVYAKPMGRPMVDTFITEVSQDTWIYFPWDTGLAFQPPIRDGEL